MSFIVITVHTFVRISVSFESVFESTQIQIAQVYDCSSLITEKDHLKS